MISRKSDQLVPDDLWKLTLSDLLTLILSFFVLRLSTLQFSVPPDVSFPGAAAASSGTPTPLPESAETVETGVEPGCAAGTCQAIADRLEVVLGGSTGRGPLQREFEHRIGVRSEPSKTVIVLGSGTFAPGSNELTFGAFRAVMAIARGVSARPAGLPPAHVEIKSFSEESGDEIVAAADPSSAQPASRGSSWDLANARALTVLRQLLDAGTSPNLISINGFGRSLAASSQKKSQSIWDDPRVIITVIDPDNRNKPIAGE